MSGSLLVLCCMVVLLLTDSYKITRCARRPKVLVRAGSDGDDKVDMKGLPGMKGYYRRPSRAIEKGGGFFVPGLEGERIRLLTAVALFAMFSLNRAGQVVQTFPQVVSETTGLIMAIVLLLQGIAELFPVSEMPAELVEADYGTLPSTYLVTRQSSEKGKEIGMVEEVARSILQSCSGLTYAVALNRSGDIIVEVGPVSGDAATMTSKEGNLLVSVAQQTTTDGLDKQSFISTLVAAGGDSSIDFMRCIPSSVRSVALRKGYADTTWLIASTTDDSGSVLKEQMRWIDSLAQAPFP